MLRIHHVPATRGLRIIRLCEELRVPCERGCLTLRPAVDLIRGPLEPSPGSHNPAR